MVPEPPAGWPPAVASFPSPDAVDPAHIRWHYKSDSDKRWTPFDGFDSLTLEQHYRHLFPVPGDSSATYPSEAAGDGEATDVSQLLSRAGRQQAFPGPPAAYPGSSYPHYDSVSAAAAAYGAAAAYNGAGPHASPSHVRLQHRPGVPHPTNGSCPGVGVSGSTGRVLVRGGMYEVSLRERVGRSLYWSGEQFTVCRGAWFYDGSWEPLEQPVADAVEAEHRRLAQSGAWSQADPRAARQAIHHVEFDKFVVVWYSNGDVAVHSGRVLSKVMRGLYQKLGFEGAGEPLRRSYPVPAVWEDRLQDITHLIFVVHGIGQKMDSSSIIKNTASMRAIGQPLRDKHFDPSAGRAEFIPVEWRSALQLDGGTIDAVTPHQMLGLRQMLNDSFMDIMYYTSPLYREELLSGLRGALNSVYASFTGCYPQFEARGGRVSVVAHSLGCVILHDLVTGWRPGHDTGVVSSAAAQLRGHGAPFHEIDRLCGFIETEVIHKMHLGHGSSLRFKIDNLFCLGSPLAVFLTMRSQSWGPHVVPSTLCRRFFNVFYPHDPVAYRMEPLASRYYTQVAPVQVHPHTAPNKARYCDLPAEPVIRPDAETAPSQSQPPATAAKQGWSLWTLMKGEKAATRSASCPGSPMQRSASVDLEHRWDYVLRESSGIGGSYLQALTSHSNYWSSADLVYFILHHVLTPEQPAPGGHM
ncbi:Phospholipase DDHD1 [Amphibalanus amphitrite]|uniref:Phospholipase DDHD1 n=1 Tax=Amphibalanus amphitrite TaxID=1232801 RepID=A0A6A4X316_AMPAM|nr:Phospholipase DDHD1 [Amphibalanus amphitrite]